MDLKEEIKSRISIVDLVSSYVELKKAGRNYKGLSPFTDEKSASFLVSPEKEIAYCFSTNQGGDIFAFYQLVESVSFCMSIQDVRFYLNGLLLELRNDSIRTVATDGHRIAVNEIVSDEFSALTEHYQLIIPRKAILELLRLLNDSDEKINVCIDQNHIRFDLPSLSFTSKLIDGRYPNYERALYIRGEKEIILQKESFRAALQRAAILSHENHHGIKIVLSENTLVIISNNAEREEAKEIVEINYGFETLELGFNGQYVLEIVSAIQTDEFKVTISDTNGSFLVEFDHESYKNLKYIIMPMKI